MDAGSVYTITNLGHNRFVPPGTTAPGNGSILDYTTGLASATTLGSTEGGSLALGTARQLRVWDNTSTFPVNLYEWEFEIRFTSALTMSTTTPATIMQTTSTTNDGRLQIQKTNVANQIALRLRVAGVDVAANWTVTDLSTVTTIRGKFGRNGNQAWLNGVEPTYGSGWQTMTQPTVVRAGEAWTINKGTNPGQVTLLSFNVWGVPLTTKLRSEFDADAYIMLRPPPGDCPRSVWTAGLPDSDSFEVALWSHETTVAATFYLRGEWSTTLAGLDSAPNTTSVKTFTAAAQKQRLEFTGLPSDTEIYWRIAHSTDNVTYRPLAGGYQRLRTLGGTAQPRIFWGLEGHVNDETDTSGSHVTPAFGLENVLDAGAVTEKSSVIGKQHANYMTAYAAWESGVLYTVGVNIGDDVDFIDNAVVYGAGTDDVNPEMWRAHTNACEQTFYLDKMCPWIRSPGNHALIGANAVMNGDPPDALRKQALELWVNSTPNKEIAGDLGMTAEGHPEVQSTPTTWATGVVQQVGDIVRPTTDNLRRYVCTDNIGNVVTTTEPAFDDNPAGAFITGAGGEIAYALLRGRWDSAAIAALAYQASATGNTTSIRTWGVYDLPGSVSIFCADSETSTLQGYEDLEDTAEEFADFTFGAIQTAAIVSWANSNPARIKLFVSHRHTGGMLLRLTVAEAYGRGAGYKIGDAEYYTGVGDPESPNELTLDQLFAITGVHHFTGHDHHGVHCRSKHGTHHWKSVTSGASSHSSLGVSAPSRGWVTTLHQAEFGTPESQGTLDSTGTDLTADGMISFINVIGYQDIQTYSDGAIRVRTIETVLPTKSRTVSASTAGYLTRIRADVARLIGTQDLTVSGGNLSLVDDLNPTPAPLKIGLVLQASDVSTAVGSGVYNEASAESKADANVPLNWYDPSSICQEGMVWEIGLPVEVGQYVFPTTHCGLVAVVTTAGNTDSVTEPTWGTLVGATITDNATDGTAVYKMLPIGLWPSPALEADLPTSIPLKAGASGVFRAQWVPRVVHDSGLVVAPSSSGRAGGLSIRRRGIGL